MNSANSSSKKAIGAAGEQAVVEYLMHRNFTVLEQNFLIRGGEIDIIATRDDLGIFVEVKTRLDEYFTLSEVITPTKQKVLVRTAEYYLARMGTRNEYAWRFDVALVTHRNSECFIEYIENAFYG